MYRTASTQEFMTKLTRGPVKAPIAVIGAIGSGKTQIIRSIESRVLAELPNNPTERLVLVDTANKYTECLPVSDWSLLFLGIEDPRSVYWDIAKDLVVPGARSAFARAFVNALHRPKGDLDSFWVEHEYDLLLKALDWCCQQAFVKNTAWSWSDLLAAVEKIANEAEGSLSKSVMASTLNLMKGLWPIAASFAAKSNRIRFSIREWYGTANPAELPGNVWTTESHLKYRSTLIVSNRRAFLGESCLSGAFLAVLTQGTWSLKTKTWIFIDEAADTPLPANVILGSLSADHKGFQYVLGYQDTPQLDILYGQNFAENFVINLSGLLICRSPSPETLSLLGRIFGRDGELTAEILRLGPKKNGILSLGTLADGRLHKYLWPYITWPKVREGSLSSVFGMGLDFPG